jgi:hypothetical protein
MSEVENFANRLSTTIEQRFLANRHPYMTVATIQQAIQAALTAENRSDEFPRMLYRARGETRVVASVEEETAALREGFIHRAPPPFEPGFPKFMREKITLEGGNKWPSGDVRRVMLRTPEEERLFFAVVEHEEWTADDGTRGGRGISLDELVQNRRETLMRLAGAAVFENALEAPYETNVPDDTSQAGQNPDEDSPPEAPPNVETQE